MNRDEARAAAGKYARITEEEVYADTGEAIIEKFITRRLFRAVVRAAWLAGYKHREQQK